MNHAECIHEALSVQKVRS